MPVVALTLFAAFAALGFGWRSWLQHRRTGSAGFHGVTGSIGSVEWFAGVGFVAAMAAAFFAPVLQLAGVVEPLSFLHAPWIHITGIVVAIAGVVLLILTIEVQVRVVEEPYLATKHGDAYRDYTATVGRFVPAVGRISC